VVQACVLHLNRNTFRYASRRYRDQMAKDLRPVYTAPTEAAAEARGHFPTEQAALKCLYLVTRSLDPTGKGRPAGRCAGNQP
jgi:transposase-like protein